MTTAVTLVIGLPGSGKTTLARSLAALSGAFLVDDAMAPPDWPEPGVPIVFVDARMCEPSWLANLKQFLTDRYPGATFDAVYFANDVEACLRNAWARTDGRNVMADIRRLHCVYAPPADARPVWREAVEPGMVPSHSDVNDIPTHADPVSGRAL